jgi:N-succinyldiaminopimelate aminotransferase
MSVRRLDDIPGFNIDRVAAAAGDDPEVLRLENLDTDMPPPRGGDCRRPGRRSARTTPQLAAVHRPGRPQGGPSLHTSSVAVGRATTGAGRSLSRVARATGCSTHCLRAGSWGRGRPHRPDVRRHAQPGASGRRCSRLVPLHVVDGEWRLNLDALTAALTDRTRVIFLINASFPTGWVASDDEWEAVASVCRDRDLPLLYWGGFESVLFDGRAVRHPAAPPGMRDRTVTVGAPTLEQRMIAWRLGWVVAPGELVNDVSRVHMYNGLVANGFAQIGTRVALRLSDEHVDAANSGCGRIGRSAAPSSRVWAPLTTVVANTDDALVSDLRTASSVFSTAAQRQWNLLCFLNRRP